MQALHPLPKSQSVARKLHGKLNGLRPAIVTPAEAAAARSHVDAFLAKAKRSRIANTPAFKRLETYLIDHVSRGGDPADLLSDLATLANRAMSKHRPLIQFASEIAHLFRKGDARRRLIQEVLQPARMHLISSQEAWDRIRLITGRQVLRESASRAPSWTICIGVGMEGGAVAGVEGACGIGGLRFHNACFFYSGSVAVGAYAEATACIQVSFSPKPPPKLKGVDLCIAGSAAYVVAGEVTFAFYPKSLHKPSIEAAYLIDWRFDGFNVGLGFGEGFEASAGLEYTQVWCLHGTAS